MPNIEWNDISDWDSSQSSSGIDHNNDPYTYSSPGKLKQGYQKQWPPLTHGLVGWWPLHTDKPVDLSGNGNHGTLNGGATTGVAGRGGLQATSFDGTDDYYSLPGGIVDGLSAVTVSTWVRFRDLNNGSWIALFDTNDGSTKPVRLFVHNDGGVFAFAINGSWEKTSVVPDPDVWYHVVGVHTGSSVRVYVNGSLEVEASQTATINSSTAGSLAAEPGGNFYLNGMLCDTRLYNRSLSSAEIQTLYEWGSADLARPPTDGVARYPLDGDATDSWGSNDGTTNGGVSWSSDAIRGQSADFDGADDNVTLPGNYTGSGSFAVSVWVKRDSSWSSKSGENVFYSYTDTQGGGGNGLIFGWTNTANRPSLGVHNGSGWTFLEPNHDIPASEWLHYVGIWDGTEAKYYINGTLVASGATLDTSLLAYEYAGSYNQNQGHYFNGHIDDVRIYDYALAPSEVHELYRWGTRGIDLNKHTVMQ